MDNKDSIRKWEPSISCYRNIVALKFSTEEDNFSALERLCGLLHGLPYMAPDERTIIIPAEAEGEFVGLFYNKQKISWAAESQVNYSKKKAN